MKKIIFEYDKNFFMRRSTMLRVSDKSIRRGIVPIDYIDIEDVSSSVSYALPNGVVPQPVRNTAIACSAETGGSQALVESNFEALRTSQVLQSGGRKQPASTAENAIR